MLKLSTITTLSCFILFAFGQEDKGTTTRALGASQFESCLKKSIPNAKVLTKGPDFDKANFQWNLRNPVTPLGIFQPSDKDQVQKAVQCSLETEIRVVAKCGGHSYEKYSFGTGEEVIVDLVKLDQVNADAASRTAIVGAGSLLGAVYYKLFNQGGFAVPAGSCPTVGVAGHTLGGGYGFSSRKYGFMVDNLLRAEIVLPNGEATYASETHNEDLFWALRGAGTGNFGIVTEFKFKIFKTPSVVTHLSFKFGHKDFEDAFEHFQNWAATDPDSSITAVAHINKYGFNLTAVILTDTDSQREEIVKSVQKAFPLENNDKEWRLDTNFIQMIVDLGDLEGAEVETLANVNHELMPKKFFRAKSGYVDRKLTRDEIKVWKSTINKGPEKYQILFDLQGGALNNKKRTDTALVHRHKPLYSIQLIGDWPENKLQEVDEDYAEIYLEDIKNFLSEEAFQNYIDAKVDPLKYYAENYERLKEIKAKYDPHDWFKYEKSIPHP
jgi:FAD/FMN-containing dehydrogenase